jgi:hypothetical protein
MDYYIAKLDELVKKFGSVAAHLPTISTLCPADYIIQRSSICIITPMGQAATPQRQMKKIASAT